MLTPQQVANFFLSKRNHDIDNLKLNKLLFISLGCGLALPSLNFVLFSEDVQAWAKGPIIPSIFYEFNHHGIKTIKGRAKIVDFKYNDFAEFEPCIEDYSGISEEDKTLVIGLLDKVWEVYGKYTPLDLVQITHQSGSPWSQIYKTNRIAIPRNVIKEYYERVLG